MADSYAEARLDEYIAERDKCKKRGVHFSIITFILVVLSAISLLFFRQAFIGLVIIFFISFLICAFSFSGYFTSDIKIKSIENGTKYREELEKSIFYKYDFYFGIACLVTGITRIYNGDIIGFILFSVLGYRSFYRLISFFIEFKKDM